MVCTAEDDAGQIDEARIRVAVAQDPGAAATGPVPAGGRFIARAMGAAANAPVAVEIDGVVVARAQPTRWAA